VPRTAQVRGGRAREGWADARSLRTQQRAWGTCRAPPRFRPAEAGVLGVGPRQGPRLVNVPPMSSIQGANAPGMVLGTADWVRGARCSLERR